LSFIDRADCLYNSHRYITKYSRGGLHTSVQAFFTLCVERRTPRGLVHVSVCLSRFSYGADKLHTVAQQWKSSVTTVGACCEDRSFLEHATMISGHIIARTIYVMRRENTSGIRVYSKEYIFPSLFLFKH
jgi:hypothetical protein